MGVRIISEPGRYFAASAFTVAVNIIAKRQVPRDIPVSGELTANDEPVFMYYVNDGVYGSFNCLMFDHAEVEPTLLQVRKTGRYLELHLQPVPESAHQGLVNWTLLFSGLWSKWTPLHQQCLGSDLWWTGLYPWGSRTTGAGGWRVDHLQRHGGIHHECSIHFQWHA